MKELDELAVISKLLGLEVLSGADEDRHSINIIGKGWTIGIYRTNTTAYTLDVWVHSSYGDEDVIQGAFEPNEVVDEVRKLLVSYMEKYDEKVK